MSSQSEAEENAAGERSWATAPTVEEAIQIEPREALFYGMLGEIEFHKKNYTQAISFYQKAIERNPVFFSFHLGKGLAHHQLKQPQLAQLHLEKSVKLLPTKTAYQALADLDPKYKSFIQQK